MPLPLIGLAPPTGWSSIYPGWKLHMYPQTLQRPLSWGPHCCQWWGRKVNQEPRPMSKHQIVWTIPGYCRMGCIIGMHYFSQMRWPVGFLIFSQLPDHVHKSSGAISLPSHLFVGRQVHGPQLFDAKDLAHFLNHTTSEASNSITQESWLGPQR